MRRSLHTAHNLPKAEPEVTVDGERDEGVQRPDKEHNSSVQQLREDTLKAKAKRWAGGAREPRRFRCTLKFHATKVPHAATLHQFTHSIHQTRTLQTHSHRLQHCSRLPSTPPQARPGPRLTSTAAARGVLLLQVYSWSTPGLLQVYSRSTRPCRRRRWTSRAAPRAPAPWSCA